jgi:hypothetical protein
MLVKDILEYLQKCNPHAAVFFEIDGNESAIECVEYNIRSNSVAFHSTAYSALH